MRKVRSQNVSANGFASFIERGKLVSLATLWLSIVPRWVFAAEVVPETAHYGHVEPLAVVLLLALLGLLFWPP